MASLPETISRLAVTRYRFRLLVVRLTHARPTSLEIVNLVLAVIGGWSVIYAALRWLRLTGFTAEIAGAVVVVAGGVLLWRLPTRRPQNVFKAAAKSEARFEDLRSLLVAGMRNDVAYECLVRLYQPLVDLVSQRCVTRTVGWPTDRAGRRCLVVTLPADPLQRLDELVEPAGTRRGASWLRRVSEFAPERQMYMAATRRSVLLANKFGDEDGMNAILDEIDCGERLRVTIGSASYGQIVRTSDSLINEFALFAYIASRSAFRKRPLPLWFRADDVLKVLPWRREVHSWDARHQLLLAPRGRAAGVGVSMVLTRRDAGGAAAFVARRSSSVGTYPDAMHVIPSGMMNLHGDPDRPDGTELASLPRLAMMAEFIEECFDVEELSGHSTGNFAGRVAHETRSRGLTALDPELTGLAIDLLNLRTEICGVLDLTEHSQVVDDFTLSWEYTHNERLRTLDLVNGTCGLDRADYVQSGAGSLHLAACWAAARSAQP